MPSTSKKQHNLMAAVAHNPAFAKKVGISQDVGKHFIQADKGKHFKEGGDVEKEMKAAKIFAKAGEKKLAAHERREAAGKEKDTPAIAKKEEAVLKRAKAPKDVQEYEKKEHKAMGYKKGGHVKKHTKHMRRGGSSAPMVAPRRRPNPAAVAALMGAAGAGAGPAAMGAPAGVPGMAHGGGVHHHHHHYYGGGGVEMSHGAGVEKMIKGKSKHGDGAAKKGHTKGKFR